MGDDRVLVRVSAAELPLRARALLDATVPRPADARYLARCTHVSWVPAAWLAGLLLAGLLSLRSTIAAGLDPASGDERFVYGALAAVCLLGAMFAAGKFLQGLAERRALGRGDYRQGLHVLGAEGLLIAGRDTHTWVPRTRLPAPLDRSGTTGAGSHSPSFAYVIVDDRERMERLDCGIATKNALGLWGRTGELPEGDGWV